MTITSNAINYSWNTKTNPASILNIELGESVPIDLAQDSQCNDNDDDLVMTESDTTTVKIPNLLEVHLMNL